jgi:hypothetical protein
VKNSIMKAMQYDQIVDVMYMAKNSEVTKRRIKVLKIYGESFQAFCFLRKTKRTFLIGNVLALTPLVIKERSII